METDLKEFEDELATTLSYIDKYKILFVLFTTVFADVMPIIKNKYIYYITLAIFLYSTIMNICDKGTYIILALFTSLVWCVNNKTVNS